MSAPSRPRVGFLGVGWIGRHRMAAMAQAGSVEIAALADASPDALAAAASLAPGAACLGSFEELLEAGLDGLVIATPSAMHAEQSVRALERGLAVFCQKPLGRDAAEARAVVEAARGADRLLAVDLSYRHTQSLCRLRDLVAGGELGRVFAVDLTFHNAYGPDKPWFYEPALSGGGCMMDLGVHLVDLALWLTGFPSVVDVTASLFAGGAPLDDPRRQVEDYGVATLVLRPGIVARIACSWRLQAGRDAVIEASVYGTEGGAAMRNVEGSFYDLAAERFRGTSREPLAGPPDDWGGRAAAAWARRLAADASFSSDANEAIAVAQVLDRIYASAAARH